MIDARFPSSLPPYIAYELKTCEFCARNFTREVGTQTKYCRQCRAKQMADRKPISITEAQTAKKNPAREPKMTRARAIVQRTNPEAKLRAAWLKSVGEKRDPVEEQRNAWHLH